MAKPPLNILMIEDDLAEAELVKGMLAEAADLQFFVQHARYLEEGMTLAATNDFDVILVDLGLPDSQGLETALTVRKDKPSIPIVILTILQDEDVALKALEMDIQDYLLKGEINPEVLRRSIRYAIQRKHDTDLLAARAADLKAANDALEAFTYTVAHDLRKPLSVVNGYCQAIKEFCAEKLDEECLEYLQAAFEGTLRMNRLIESLLKFSRAGHVALRWDTVDLSALARNTADDLMVAEPERKVNVTIAQGIEVEGDGDLLRVVLDNLFSNAWKYTRCREEATIEFGVTAMPDRPAYFVRDNGSGFDMATAGEMFAPFKRLPGAESYKGFGIGLATVDRIISRHGGKVWAEGVPGNGATFYFTLTTRQAHPAAER